MSGKLSPSRVLTLVFTDLADSTALKTARGDHAVGELIARHRLQVTRLAGECAGRIIDWAGDGCFLTFETSSAGVLFGLRLQEAHAADPGLPGVRVGIHMGEVTADFAHAPPRVEGLAVDLAARICSLARPGQVLMSAAIYQSARQRIGVEAIGKPVLWQLHGAYALKGFDSPLELGEAALEGVGRPEAPVRSEKARRVAPRRTGAIIAAASVVALASVAGVVWIATRPVPEAGANLADVSSARDPIDSLAVLPLDNLSGDPAQDYFADGMTEALTAELAKISSLRVKSRTTVMRYKDSPMSGAEIARELNVEGLIEGSVQQDGDQVRITVQFIDGRTDDHVWSESYTNTITSVLTLQSEVALAIAEAIRAELSGDERARIARSREVLPEAYNEFLLGLAYRERGTPEGVITSLTHFDRATQLDPDFAEAWAYLAMTNTLVLGSGEIEPSALVPQARRTATRALELDPELSSAHASLGIVSFVYDWDWKAAEYSFRKALELDLNNPYAHMFLGMFLAAIGRYAEATEHAKLSLELESQNPWPLRTNYLTLVTTGHVQDALSGLERLLAARPDFVPAKSVQVIALKNIGLHDEAYAAASRLIEYAQPLFFSKVQLAQLEIERGNRETGERLLNEVLAAERIVDVAGVVWMFVLLGEFEKAREWINIGVDRRSVGLLFMRTIPYSPAMVDNPQIISFRSSTVYRELIKKMDFPPLPPEHPGYADEQAWLAKQAGQ